MRTWALLLLSGILAVMHATGPVHPQDEEGILFRSWKIAHADLKRHLPGRQSNHFLHFCRGLRGGFAREKKKRHTAKPDGLSVPLIVPPNPLQTPRLSSHSQSHSQAQQAITQAEEEMSCGDDDYEKQDAEQQGDGDGDGDEDGDEDENEDEDGDENGYESEGNDSQGDWCENGEDEDEEEDSRGPNNRGLPRAPDDEMYPEGTKRFTAFTPTHDLLQKRHINPTRPASITPRAQQASRADDRNNNDDIAQTLLAQGDELLIKGEIEEALTTYIQAVHAKPTSSDAFFRLAVVAENTDPPDKETALALANVALSLKPSHPEALCLEGHMYDCSSCDIEGAEESYRSALAASPQHVGASFLLARLLHYKLSQLDEADKLYARVLEAKPDKASIWCDHARLHMQRTDFAAAEALLKRATKIDPAHAHALILLARVRWMLHKDHEGALSIAQRAVALAPADIPSR
jgi:tetratricopeptide (TPR) repeat protein